MEKNGWLTLPVSRTACGKSNIPVIRDMFLDAMKHHDSVLYGYANGDISFDNGMSTAIKFLMESDLVHVVVGRIGIGMWIVSYARAVNATIIDITKTVRAIHMTTKSGNFESHWKPNSKCNHELYAKYQAKPSNWGL
ncbi:uncharacterized protein LOC126830477 [Patella vulgata]|uniref:uncharacterized protein LOC126830477 n=1 Tax=Patella vulgata TaxID=6465 RepID=UPI0024A90762|nr:uncharacterized protein LOC126830477 [Patella vulgata]